MSVAGRARRTTETAESPGASASAACGGGECSLPLRTGRGAQYSSGATDQLGPLTFSETSRPKLRGVGPTGRGTARAAAICFQPRFIFQRTLSSALFGPIQPCQAQPLASGSTNIAGTA